MHHCLQLGPSSEKNYVEMWNFSNFSDFLNGHHYLNKLYPREDKTYGFLVFLIKQSHQSIGFNVLLAYIRSILVKKNKCEMWHFSNFSDF